MAEFYLKSLDSSLQVFSAGTAPAKAVHPLALEILDEAGMSTEGASPKNLDQFLTVDFDYVITVCGNAEENCPAFLGKVRHQIHIGFADPAALVGNRDEIKAGFQGIFKKIQRDFLDFYQTKIQAQS